MFFDIAPFYTFLIILGIWVSAGIKILKEFERAVIFRLGKLMGIRGPGIIYVTPLIERMVRVNLDQALPDWRGLSKDDLNQRFQEMVSKSFR